MTYVVYSFTQKPDYEAAYNMETTSLQARVMSSEIYPKQVFTNNMLSIKMMGATKDEYGYLSVTWFRNGNEIPGVSGTRLAANHIRKGQKIHAEVNLLGPDALIEPVILPVLTVLNSPPVIASGSLVYKEEPTDAIVAMVTADDADGDKLKYSYRWFRNNVKVETTKTGSIKVDGFEQGDRIHAIIMANDGGKDVASYKCDPVPIGSNAPMITSQPPARLTQDRRYVYQLTVEAPDPETLVYEVLKGPSGMKISPDGYLAWKLPESQAGSREYDVVVRVSDASGGESYQEFSINLSAKAADQDG